MIPLHVYSQPKEQPPRTDWEDRMGTVQIHYGAIHASMGESSINSGEKSLFPLVHAKHVKMYCSLAFK